MTESRRIQPPKAKRAKKEAEETGGPVSSAISEEEKQKKLKELDEFMEDVLQKAGEEFVDDFRQVEGE
jgi:hypothetical protein